MALDVTQFFRSPGNHPNLTTYTGTISGHWPEEICGHIFVIGPHHRHGERHLFVGTGEVSRWDLQADKGSIKVNSARLKTWDSFWQNLLPWTWKGGFFPASMSLLGIGELANTAVINMNGRALLTADAGRFWEIDPATLQTITPVGYFDEHVVTAPGLAFPMVMNTAHSFYDPPSAELIGCELKARPRLSSLFSDMISLPFITSWDGQGKLRNWQLDDVELDGCTHSVLVTEDYVIVPDMPFQIGLTTLLGLKVAATSPYPKTQLHLVRRDELKPGVTKVPSKMVTFPGYSFHFVTNYYHIDGEIRFFAVQLSTTSITEAIEPGDTNHFTGKPFPSEYWGIPWMFSFDPGTMRKVSINLNSPDPVVHTETFIHPGWWATALYASDPREQFSAAGHSAIYQGYLGFPRELISRRQYLEFRDNPNRLLEDHDLPQMNLPSVLACLPYDKNWDELTEAMNKEKVAHPETPLPHLGANELDFYVFDQGEILDGVQFIPEGDGYLFVTVLAGKAYEAWLFDPKQLHKGPMAKVHLPEGVHFGFTLHSEYFADLNAKRPDYHISRVVSMSRNLTIGVGKTVLEAARMVGRVFS